MSTLRFCGALLPRVTGFVPAGNPVFRQKLNFLSTGTKLLVVQEKNTSEKTELLQSANHQQQYQQFRGHRNLGHRPVEDSLHTKLWMCFLAAMIVGTNLDWKW